jgi:DNA-binding NarL/FixJ family response regulator
MLINAPIKIVIADDQVMFAEGLALMLQQYPDFEVIGAANNGEKLLQLLNGQQPHLVILDLNMPVMDGFVTCRQIREKFPEIVVVALTSYDDEKMLQRAKAAGAAGMLLKYTSSAQLANNLRYIVAKGNAGPFVSSESEIKTQIDEQISTRDSFLIKHQITDREMEVIRLIADGLNSDYIAKKLFISEHTVKTHRKNILEKLNLKNTAELINFIHTHKIL